MEFCHLNFVKLISDCSVTGKVEKKFSSYDISNKKNFTYDKLTDLIIKQIKKGTRSRNKQKSYFQLIIKA